MKKKKTRIGAEMALLLKSRYASKSKKSAKLYNKSDRRKNKIPRRPGGVFLFTEIEGTFLCA